MKTFFILLIFIYIKIINCSVIKKSISFRACHCDLGVYRTKNCCNKYNGLFRHTGALGICEDPKSGSQDIWGDCCITGYDCWDYATYGK